MTSLPKCLWRLLPPAALYLIAALPGWSQCVQPVKLETVTLPYQLSAVNGSFTVQDPNNCGWTIGAKPSWIGSIAPLSGRGSQLVNFTVAAPTQSGPRADIVVIGNQFETVFQQAAPSGPFCTQRPVGPSPINTAAAGGRYTFSVGGGDQCSWGVTSTASWIGNITLRPLSPDGSILFGASVDFTVAPFTIGPIATGSTGRAAVILAANLPVTVYQAPNCTYTVSTIVEPDTAAQCPFQAACFIQNVIVSPNLSTCSWTATKPADAYGPALNVTRTGYSYIPLHVNNYSTATVSTTVHLTGTNWSFDQHLSAPGYLCNTSTIHLTAPASAISSLGGAATIGVTAPQGCAWNVTKPAWLSIASSPGSGSGNLVLSAAATSAARSDAVTVAGQSVTVAQSAPQACTSTTVSPSSVTIPAAGGSQTVTVSVAPAGCLWTAAGASGFNVTTTSGTATISAASSNPSSHPRTGIVTIAGKSVSVTQLGVACSLQVTTPSQIPAAGGTVSIQVTDAPSDCTWTATSTGTFFHIGPMSGAGSGQISVVANGPNTGRLPLTGSVSAGSLSVPVSQAGTPQTVPAAHTTDYDHDGHADPMVFRPSNGTWYLTPSTGNCPANFTHISAIPGQQTCMRQFGLSGDIPVTADFDGDGVKDLGVWRQSQSTFFLETSSGSCPANWVGTHNIDGIPMCTRQLAVGAVTPVAGDFDGDGRADLAFFRASDARWIVWPSSGAIYAEFNESLSGTSAFMRQFGIPGDLPAPGDYDRDGITDVALYRPANPGVMILLPSSDVCPAHWSPTTATPDSRRVCIRVTGTSTDVPLPADFDADGVTDMALFRGAGQVWTVYPSASVVPGVYSNQGTTGEGQYFASRQWGLPGDIAVPQDFDGDLRADLTVFRPAEGNWYVFPSTGSCPRRILRHGATPDGWSVCILQWGLPGDIPMR